MLEPMYLDSIAGAFERVVTERVPMLREPHAIEGSRAFRAIGLLVETLAGYAVGVVAGELVRGARAWLGDELAAGIRVVTVPRSLIGLELTPQFLDDAEARPLVDELGVRLQARLRLAVADVRATIASTIALVPEQRAPTAATMLERLAASSLLDERLADELERGWAFACAVIEGAPLPEVGSPRARELWAAWCRLAGAEVKRPAPSYIVAIS